MTTERNTWSELCRCDAADEARTLTTTIAAMEFDVRLRDESDSCVIEVRTEDLADLRGVLDQILDEQGEFDARLQRRDRQVMRWQRIFLGVMIGLIAVLGILRLIEL